MSALVRDPDVGNKALSAGARLRILTYYRKNNDPRWLRNVDLYESLAQEDERNRRKKLPLLYRLWRETIWAWRLFHLSKRYDAVLTGSDRIGLFFGAAQHILRRRRIPHIFLNFFIYQKGRKLGWALRRYMYRIAIGGASHVLVYRRAEVDTYSRVLDIPAHRFCFVSDHSTVFSTEVDIRDEGYIFSGGDTNRDYSLLFRAVKGLPYRVIIVTFRKDLIGDVEVPENVEVMRPVPKQRFLGLMARSSLVVIPLRQRSLHMGGRQTYLDAMTLGKPVVITDLEASDYVKNGLTGLLTPPGDIAALRESIWKLMGDRELAMLLGRNAKEASANFTPEKFFGAVFDLCSQDVSAEAKSGLRREPVLRSLQNSLYPRHKT